MLLSGCFSTRTREWLDSHSVAAIPEMNIEGRWTSPDWGETQLYQQGKSVTGSIGGYSVQGVVNGTTAYLVLPSVIHARYTVVLWRDKSDLLVGKWLRGAIASGPGYGYPIMLRRRSE